MSEILVLKKINQYFYQGGNKIAVLKDLDLSVQKSKKIGIIGSSGSGKSSLLNIASLMETPKSGKVFILGKCASILNDTGKSYLRKKNIGYIHQKNTLLEEFTAFENIYLSLLINNFNKNYAREKTSDLLDLVSMSHRGSHRPSQLSGGEQQRIVIARAIGNNPELIIADEPTGNLDNKNSLKIIEELINTTEKHKTALLLATHDSKIANLMDTVYELTDSKLKKVSNLL